jgi:hypothetical protein
MTGYSTRWFAVLFPGLAFFAGCTREVFVVAPPAETDGGAPLSNTPNPAREQEAEADTADTGKTPPPPKDGGSETAEEIKLVAPQLSYDFGTNVYTATFRIKNRSGEDILEFSSINVTGSVAFPEIDRAVCPPDTPGYPWSVPPGAISAPLAIVFASSSANLKTAIDLTCGSKKALQSVPYGFDANPPFIITIALVLSSGKSLTLEDVFTR